ncbi:uncharacterized protein (TIGR00255 family) [Haloferula luteola]|uniref:Uncharacterized protein (TIGR00255 family) n=1 Tax=Haloferula luteola TaxID=595692 RepID=A0A840UYG9_9BACT|nr:YicC/YloC family endoribonuclease [Haloferula luteola]MBB5350043.1 uncharacterized protein (TIGR00255 family) [Haloferula luteola]
MHSMTGFGRGSATSDEGTATVEIAGVNRKQAEVVIAGIRDLPELENQIRKAVLTRISRGRLQVTLDFQARAGDRSAVAIDPNSSMELEAAFRQLSDRLGREVLPLAADFLRAPGIVTFEDRVLDPKTAWSAIEAALETALGQLLEMRANEGRDLAQDLTQRLNTLAQLRTTIGELAPARPERYREALAKRMADAGLEFDLADDRVLRELVLFTDRIDITEELTRLDSHFRKFREYLTGSEPAGRHLDFLCQEIHREFNTIGSKASDAQIAQHVVTAKAELEKIREQVQNVE